MKKVFLVKQHQTESEYDNYIVAVVDSEAKAKQLCREYNKEYAENVRLDKTGLFTGEYDIDFSGYYHYLSLLRLFCYEYKIIKGEAIRENTKLVKIIGNKAIFIKDNMLVAVDIDKKALAVLDYYKKIPVNDL